MCYEWPATRRLRERAGLVPIDARLVHAQHDLTIHRPPVAETLFIAGRWLPRCSARRATLVVYRFVTRDEEQEPVSTTDFSALYRGCEARGRRPASATRWRIRRGIEEPLKDIGDISVAATAAHVYTECARIWNPIHTDVAYARAAGLPDIILHGTATLALSVSASAGIHSE